MKSRKSVGLSESFNKRWLGYAAMAGGAGVGLLGAAQPARADIVYTPADISFGASLSFSLNPNSPNVFTLNNTSYTTRAIGEFYIKKGFLGIGGGGNGGSVVAGQTWVRQLQQGAYIGPQLRTTSGNGTNNRWSAGELMMKWTRGRFVSSSGGFYYSGYSTGSWRGGEGFVGLRFSINGQEHYGWAQLLVNRPPYPPQGMGYSGTLIGYAYDTIPNQGLDAGQTTSTPEPGTLGLLALGSLGLAFWRRRKAGVTV